MSAKSAAETELRAYIAQLATDSATPMMDAGELMALGLNLAASVCGPELTAVEIGAFKGSTTVFCNKILRHLGVKAKWIVVDPFDLFDADEGNPQGVAHDFLVNIREAGFQNQVTAIVATSEGALTHIPATLDFVFIDGYHSYEVCKFDLDNYGSRLKPGGGLFIDDYTEAYPGVIQACDEFFAERHHFKILETAWYVSARARGLTVMERWSKTIRDMARRGFGS